MRHYGPNVKIQHKPKHKTKTSGGCILLPQSFLLRGGQRVYVYDNALQIRQYMMKHIRVAINMNTAKFVMVKRPATRKL